MADNRLTIACNIAQMFKNGDFVNLGVGIPTMVSNFIPSDITVLLHGQVGQDVAFSIDKADLPEWEKTRSGENGDWRNGHKDLGNAGNQKVSLIPGGCCFDSSISFAMARGGHLDATVLGGLQTFAPFVPRTAPAPFAIWPRPSQKLRFFCRKYPFFEIRAEKIILSCLSASELSFSGRNPEKDTFSRSICEKTDLLLKNNG